MVCIPGTPVGGRMIGGEDRVKYQRLIKEIKRQMKS